MASDLRIINKVLEQTKYKPACLVFSLKNSRVEIASSTDMFFFRQETLQSILVSVLPLTTSEKIFPKNPSHFSQLPCIFYTDPHLRNMGGPQRKHLLRKHLLASLVSFSKIENRFKIKRKKLQEVIKILNFQANTEKED